MSINKSTDSFIATQAVANLNQWLFNYPNTADFNFNYFNLLQEAGNNSIGTSSDSDFRICIIGMGVAGLTAARELLRSGFTNIDMFEASDRIGGRNYSIPAPNQNTTFEMGAMRMPFFKNPGDGNCVLDYYASLFNISTCPFPDPGSPTVANTGIYVNNGLGPDPSHPYSSPKMDIWNSSTPPPQVLNTILQKWKSFQQMFTSTCSQYYGTDQWQWFWQSIVDNYYSYNFRELVYLPSISSYDSFNPGYFGGLGMTDEEAWNFYVIGAGDGGWGAFYDISCLYPIRTLLFGFSTNHQLVQGTFVNDSFEPGAEYGQTIYDNGNHLLTSPAYLGLQSVAESLLYQPVTSNNAGISGQSFYTLSKTMFGINFYTQTPVTSVKRLDSGLISINGNDASAYNAVIITPTTWALEMSNVFTGFGYNLLPYYASMALKESHWITSCKVFYPLRESYWKTTNIPQVINTDTFLQDVYAISAFDTDPGVLLVSYTWEDDASKLEAVQSDAELAAMCLAELDRILVNSQNIGIQVSPFVDKSLPVVIHWERQPTYRGCAKLYRQRSFNLDYALQTYNQNISAQSGLYFAGEGYSVEGGWTEPALRSALDAVIHLINNSGGSFNNSFSFSDYPVYPDYNPSVSSSAQE